VSRERAVCGWGESVKTPAEWFQDEELNRANNSGDVHRAFHAAVDWVRRIQEDARAAGFAEGFEKGAKMALAVTAGGVPLGNNPAKEEK
jgi:hypothetical protein